MDWAYPMLPFYLFIFGMGDSEVGVRETLTAYFIPGRVGHGAWTTWDLRRVFVVVVVVVVEMAFGLFVENI